jgi:hypothetical protein
LYHNGIRWQAVTMNSMTIISEPRSTTEIWSQEIIFLKEKSVSRNLLHNVPAPIMVVILGCLRLPRILISRRKFFLVVPQESVFFCKTIKIDLA